MSAGTDGEQLQPPLLARDERSGEGRGEVGATKGSLRAAQRIKREARNERSWSPRVAEQLQRSGEGRGEVGATKGSLRVAQRIKREARNERSWSPRVAEQLQRGGEDSGEVGATKISLRWALPLILCLYLLFGILHAFSTPVGGTGYQDAPDEAAHISYIQTLASGHLPTKAAPHGNIISNYPDYEWHQPPLYYTLAVPFLSAGPYAVRLFSLLCGLFSLVFIYKTAKLLRPTDELIWLCAVGIAAFTPAHVAILSAVNNDALLELCFSAVVYLLVRSIQKAPSTAESLFLGIELSAAILTKTTALLLIPVVVGALLLGTKVGTLRGVVLKHAAISLSVVLIFCGWWFVRNASLYGEILPLHEFQQAFGKTKQAVDVVHITGWPGYWLLVTQWCFQSFWAVYGTAQSAVHGVPLFLPESVYLLMLVVCTAAIAGVAKLHIRRATAFIRQEQYGIYVELLTLGLVTASYVLFVSHYFQTQGRYLYPAMSAISIILAMGWLELYPARYKRLAAVGLLALLCLICIAFLLQTSNRIQPAVPPRAASLIMYHISAVCDAGAAIVFAPKGQPHDSPG